MSVINYLTAWITAQHLLALFIALVFLVVGVFAARKISQAVGRIERLDLAQRSVLQKLVYYGILFLTITMSLSEIGVDLKVVLGAAGVLTVAVGFAAQTSASNLISGLFLIVERPFVVGNIIEVDRFVGEVYSIDLLSCQIKTFDNLLVRIPNETMVKSNIVNRTGFATRRVEVLVGVGYSSDIDHVKRILLECGKSDSAVVSYPEPTCIVNDFGASSVDFKLMVWAKSEIAGDVPPRLREVIKKRLDQEKIEIPFPHQVQVPYRG